MTSYTTHLSKLEKIRHSGFPNRSAHFFYNDYILKFGCSGFKNWMFQFLLVSSQRLVLEGQAQNLSPSLL
jgi:hypothetical protein